MLVRKNVSVSDVIVNGKNVHRLDTIFSVNSNY
jgi:hypothetical protein